MQKMIGLILISLMGLNGCAFVQGLKDVTPPAPTTTEPVSKEPNQ